MQEEECNISLICPKERMRNEEGCKEKNEIPLYLHLSCRKTREFTEREDVYVDKGKTMRLHNSHRTTGTLATKDVDVRQEGG